MNRKPVHLGVEEETRHAGGGIHKVHRKNRKETSFILQAHNQHSPRIPSRSRDDSFRKGVSVCMCLCVREIKDS